MSVWNYYDSRLMELGNIDDDAFQVQNRHIIILKYVN